MAKLTMKDPVESLWFSSFGGGFEFAGARLQGSDAYLLRSKFCHSFARVSSESWDIERLSTYATA